MPFVDIQIRMPTSSHQVFSSSLSLWTVAPFSSAVTSYDDDFNTLRYQLQNDLLPLYRQTQTDECFSTLPTFYTLRARLLLLFIFILYTLHHIEHTPLVNIRGVYIMSHFMLRYTTRALTAAAYLTLTFDHELVDSVHALVYLEGNPAATTTSSVPSWRAHVLAAVVLRDTFSPDISTTWSCFVNSFYPLLSFFLLLWLNISYLGCCDIRARTQRDGDDVGDGTNNNNNNTGCFTSLSYSTSTSYWKNECFSLICFLFGDTPPFLCWFEWRSGERVEVF